MKIKEKIMKYNINMSNKNEKNNVKNDNKKIFYKTNPSGISLIVLIITIIVIIILATAIILTLNKNNPIAEANRARYESDRDSMQAIFTNTVTKIMARNQGTINIKEGVLNEVKSGVNSTIGEVIYELESPEKMENKDGKIIFDNKENTEIEYYTGRKLPIYSSGETIWSVDSIGVINLKVGGKTVGDNENSGSDKDEEDGKEGISISKQEYDNLLKEIEEIKKKKINIERVSLYDKYFDFPIVDGWTEKNYGEIILNDSIKNYKYLEFNMEVYRNE